MRDFGVLLLAVLAWPAGALGALETSGPEIDAPHRAYPASVYMHGRVDHAPIPAFARMYGTGCSTCHTAAPKLNVLGEAFRLAGYRMPENDLLIRQDEPVPLGADPWKDQWPRAIWPASLPGVAPIAIRIQTDIRARGRPEGGRDLDFRFPHELYLLAGAPIGDDVSAFFEMEWSPERGINVFQAKVAFQNVIPGLPSGAANLSLGLQDPFLLTFTGRQIDRAGVVGFSWQRFRLSQLSLTNAATATSLRSENGLGLGGGLATIEVNGVLADRLHYGVGVSQGTSNGGSDKNAYKDPYYRLRYKWGGMNLRGQYDPGGSPVLGTGGQLQDRALILEHFGYRGNETTPSAPQGSHWAVGMSARLLYGPWDAGVGWVQRSFERPFGTNDGDLSASSWFSKVEYLVFPWLLASMKYDRFDATAGAAAIPPGFSLDASAGRTLTPGLILLIRQNVRAVVEGRHFLAGDAARGRGATPGDLFLRLDVTF